MCALDYIENCFLQSNNRISSFDVRGKEDAFSKEEVLEQFIVFIKKKMRLSIIGWEPTRRAYPSHIFLSGDKGILAYVDFKYAASKEDFSDEELACDSELLLETLRSADSQLDRPVFFVYMLNYRDKQGIYFETNEQIKDRWFKNSCLSESYIPVIEEMGDFNNLIEIWNDLKKNNVRV